MESLFHQNVHNIVYPCSTIFYILKKQKPKKQKNLPRRAIGFLLFLQNALIQAKRSVSFSKERTV